MIDPSVWLAIGWTMLHFLWVGSVLLLLAALVRRACRNASADLRYGLVLAHFAALVLSPGLLFWLLFEPAGSAVVEVGIAPGIDGGIAGPAHRLDAIAGLLPWVWLLGAPVCFSFFAAGLLGTARLRRRASGARAPGELSALCDRLRVELGIRRRVLVRLCDEVATPVLVGITRPVVLLPLSAVTGCRPDQLEMVLLHELAHVRRWDNLVALLQRLAESALFFHPGVWLLSRWLRLEREHCCDALVVARTRRPRDYAATLMTLAEGAGATPALSSAAARHPLVARIERILTGKETHSMQLHSISGIAALVLGASLLTVAPNSGRAENTTAPGATAAACEHSAHDPCPRCGYHGPRKQRRQRRSIDWGHLELGRCSDCHTVPQQRRRAPRRSMVLPDNHPATLTPESCGDCHMSPSPAPPAVPSPRAAEACPFDVMGTDCGACHAGDLDDLGESPHGILHAPNLPGGVPVHPPHDPWGAEVRIHDPRTHDEILVHPPHDPWGIELRIHDPRSHDEILVHPPHLPIDAESHLHDPHDHGHAHRSDPEAGDGGIEIHRRLPARGAHGQEQAPEGMDLPRLLPRAVRGVSPIAPRERVIPHGAPRIGVGIGAARTPLATTPLPAPRISRLSDPHSPALGGSIAERPAQDPAIAPPATRSEPVEGRRPPQALPAPVRGAVDPESADAGARLPLLPGSGELRLPTIQSIHGVRIPDPAPEECAPGCEANVSPDGLRAPSAPTRPDRVAPPRISVTREHRVPILAELPTIGRLFSEARGDEDPVPTAGRPVPTLDRSSLRADPRSTTGPGEPNGSDAVPFLSKLPHIGFYFSSAEDPADAGATVPLHSELPTLDRLFSAESGTPSKRAVPRRSY